MLTLTKRTYYILNILLTAFNDIHDLINDLVYKCNYADQLITVKLR